MTPKPKAIKKFLDYFNSMSILYALHAGPEDPDADIEEVFRWLQELSKEAIDGP